MSTNGRALSSRTNHLETKHRKAWIAALGLPANRHNYFWFRRGLVELIELEGRDFKPVAAELFRADLLPFCRHPIREIAVTGWGEYAQGVRGGLERRADLAGRRRRDTTREHGAPPKHPLLGRLEQVVARGDRRAQRAVPFWNVARRIERQRRAGTQSINDRPR